MDPVRFLFPFIPTEVADNSSTLVTANTSAFS
jgi:hypothetical protein